ncbi:TIR domain-containing protein [Deinococcus wulumuqiensis]|nr:TIR domain-containing protein [Deinococcus wulumuqiensis]QII21200.1 TIR domain-containing protein [Deinococcus wulumuqiensis R12]
MAKSMPIRFTREVFKKSGFPHLTYVEHPKQVEIEESMLTPGRGIVIEGSSGVGKTSCVKRIIGTELRDFVILSGKKPDDVEKLAAISPGRNFGKIVVDDFHDLNDETKKAISNTMKTIADDEEENNRLVIIGINRAGIPLIEFTKDLAARIDMYKINRVDDEKIAELITLGEDALNISFEAKEDIIADSHGCYSIVQNICNKICIESKIRQTVQGERSLIKTNLYDIKEDMMEAFDRAYKGIARKFAIGPSYSPEGRAPYLHILYWLAKSDDWTINLQEKADSDARLRQSLRPLINNKLQIFMDKNPEFGDLIYFDNNTKTVSVENPRFMYFIKNIPWNAFAKEIGYSMEFESAYDIALSFAGTDRELAESIFKTLDARNLSIFYDFNEQSRITGEDVERYLAPIYRSEAKFIVPILGRDYPRRLWTKFETEQFKDRFKDGSIIPLRTLDSDDFMIPNLGKVGGLFYDRTKNFEVQVEDICQTLITRVRQYRRDHARISK